MPGRPKVRRLGPIGLAVGLSVLVALWAAIASGGRSAFTPVAMSFLICIGLALVRTSKRSRGSPDSAEIADPTDEVVPTERRRQVLVVAMSIAFIVGATVLYGSTMALMARDGLQPIEFFDEAFYSILGRDIGRTGVEFVSPSGFDVLPNTPPQAWYHWGEMWLTAGVIKLFSAAPIDARHFVVLPVLLLAMVSTTGSVVRALGRSNSTGAYLVGAAACLFLAPVPIIGGPVHTQWAVGMVFGITLYGSAAVAGVLCLYAATSMPDRKPSRALSGLFATSMVFLLPAHLIIAILAAVGGCAAVAWYAGGQVIAGRHLSIPMAWRQTMLWLGILAALTLAWGILTGHGIAAGGPSPGVPSFGPVWQLSTIAFLLGAGALLTVPLAAVLFWKVEPMLAALSAGATGLVVFGALAWGARLADFNMFHVFFAGVAVFLTPVAAATVWTFWHRARLQGNRVVAIAIVVVLLAQVEIGAASTIFRLQRFGPGDFEPVPVAMLEAIRALPSDAKIAYPCQPLEEQSIWDPRLASLNAHTGRAMVAMCFQADAVGPMVGAPIDPSVEAPFFKLAPQRTLYPDHEAVPSPAAIAAFLQANGIRYLYTDSYHSDRLLPDDMEIFRVGPFRLASVP